MKIISRRGEIPKISQKKIQGFYPGYTILGMPFGFFFPIPETKVVFVEYGLAELVKLVQQHYFGNGIPEPENLIRAIHEHICHHVPNICSEADPEKERKVNLWYLAKKFFAAVVSAASQGLVPQEEAERRAAICATCPFNKAMDAPICSGCWTAKFVKEAAEALSNKHTSLDGKLDTCSLCQCRLSLKVWVQKEAMQDKEISWPGHCWMLN